MSIARPLILCCLVGLACAPATATEPSAMVGAYVLSIETDTLHLDPGGQYRRVFVNVGTYSRVSVDTGRWRMSSDGSRISIAALPQRWPAHGRYDSLTGTWHQPDTLRRGFLSLGVRTGWRGDVTLEVVPELGWVYRRVVPAK